MAHFYRAKELEAEMKEEGSGAGLAIGHCTKASRILSGLTIDNEAIQENIKKKLTEAEELRASLNDINKAVYMEPIVAESKLPEIEAKNFAILRSMEEQLNAPFDKGGASGSGGKSPAYIVSIRHFS